MPRNVADREIEQLKGRRLKAQDNGDVAEEAKLCNAIGELYAQGGDPHRALQHHRVELALSEASGDRLGAAIASRKVGECECELGNYKSAIQHQTEHLKVAQSLGDEVEEQRALATLGRTYLVQSEAEGVGRAEQTILQSGNAFLRSLDVCDRLVGTVPDKEMLEMRSRLYLNLGLVYEIQENFGRARQFMEKALSIVRELGDSDTIFRCHYDLGSLHLRECHPTHALRFFQEALSLALGLRNVRFEADCHREMAQAYLQMSDIEGAKASLKKAVRLGEGSQGEREELTRQLRTVRKILWYRSEAASLGVDKAVEKMRLHERQGDLCCRLKAYQAAIALYGKQLALAEAHGVEPGELSMVYVSLARTHADWGEFSKALGYYERELELCKKNPEEECDTWTIIARERERAGHSHKSVMEAYRKAVSLAQQTDNPKRKVSTMRAVVKYCSSEPGLELAHWEEELAHLLAAHPQHNDWSSSSEEETEEDSHGSDPPDSLSSSESEEERNDDGQSHHTAKGVAVRKKARISRRNEKGETLLHVAAIEGNLALVRQLTREGADVNARDNCGWMPLHEACNQGHLEVAHALLDSGALVNDRGGAHCQGVTPLIDAATNGYLDIVRLLVERGADTDVRDAEGRTALSVVEGRLQSLIGADERCDQDEDYHAIEELLRNERRRRGRGEEGVSGIRPTVVGASRPPRSRDRSGRGVLYNSDEEEGGTTSTTHTCRSTNNPFRNFTVGCAATQQPRTSSIAKPVSTGSTASRHAKGFYNPLGQIELPALIPEGEDEEEEMGWGETATVDHWLVDDIGQPPAKRTKRRSFELSGVTADSQTNRLRKQRTSRPRPQTQQPRGSVSGDGPREQCVIEINSDTDIDMITDHWVGDLHRTPPTSPSPSTAPLLSSSSAEPPAGAPLRIRVRIEGRTYLIPCPRRSPDGQVTSVGWLAALAGERYYSQHGVQPELSLTTSDGALLSAGDALIHVLNPNEEVVGVVNQWHHPPLAERYQTACRTSTTVPHRQVLKVFQSAGSTFDLSFLGLGPSHAPPLSRTLLTCHALSSLSLSGNRLRDEGLRHLASALAGLPSLLRLNISCTGITALSLESLASPPLPPHSSAPWVNLHSLDLSYNTLGPACGRGLAHLLGHCRDLEDLYLDSCGLTDAVFGQHSELGESLRALSRLVLFTASRNPLKGAGLLQTLPRPTRLARLSLAGTCRHGAIGNPTTWRKFLTEAEETLQFLDLSYCGLGDTDVLELLNCLGECGRLHELRLAGNDLRADVVEEVTRSLSAVCVDLRGNTDIDD